MKKRSFIHVTPPGLASLISVILVSAGCAGIVVTPESQRVVTQTASAVGSCRRRGVVFALAPFSSSEQPLDLLKIRATQIGGDTVVLLGAEGIRTTKDWSAIAYRCGNVRAGDPAPALSIEAAR